MHEKGISMQLQRNSELTSVMGCNDKCRALIEFVGPPKLSLEEIDTNATGACMEEERNKR